MVILCPRNKDSNLDKLVSVGRAPRARRKRRNPFVSQVFCFASKSFIVNLICPCCLIKDVTERRASGENVAS